MFRKFALIAAVAAVFSVALAQTANTTATPEVRQLSTQIDEFGGRPGIFHFVTNEERMQHDRRFAELRKALAAVKADVAGLREPARERAAQNLATLELIVAELDATREKPAGDSAAQIEQRLNAAKGKFMCGACHGHGAMQGMHGMR